MSDFIVILVKKMLDYFSKLRFFGLGRLELEHSGSNTDFVDRHFYVVKQIFSGIFLFLLHKSEEEVSSAGEQLASNRIYGFE
jgi:hypothetical protein